MGESGKVILHLGPGSWLQVCQV